MFWVAAFFGQWLWCSGEMRLSSLRYRKPSCGSTENKENQVNLILALISKQFLLCHFWWTLILVTNGHVYITLHFHDLVLICALLIPINTQTIDLKYEFCHSLFSYKHLFAANVKTCFCLSPCCEAVKSCKSHVCKLYTLILLSSCVAGEARCPSGCRLSYFCCLPY